jgi:hypothetical protein
MKYIKERQVLSFIFVFALLAIGIISIVLMYKSKTENTLEFQEIKFPIKIYNGMPTNYIWVNRTARVTIWRPDSDGSVGPVAGAQGRVEIPGASLLGNGFVVDPKNIANGFIYFPKELDIQSHMRKGNHMNIYLPVVQSGYHDKDSPFVGGPETQFAHNSIVLSNSFHTQGIYLPFEPWK